MKSLIDLGVSPDAPTDYGLRPGAIIFSQVMRLCHENAMSLDSQIWNHELITTCLDYLDLGGVLRINLEPTPFPEGSIWYQGLHAPSFVKIISDIIDSSGFYGEYVP